MNTIQVTVDISDGARGAANHLRKLAAMLDPQDTKVGQTSEVKPVPAVKKAMKARVQEVAEEVENFDLGEEKTGWSGDDDTHETKDPVLTKTDIIAGFKNYAQAEGRDKAAKVLAKYKVKSVHDLKPETYTKVMKDIEV